MTVSPATRGKEKPHCMFRIFSPHTRAEKQKESAATRAKHSQMVKLKNPLISFLQNLLFRKCQSPLPLAFAFSFIHPNVRFSLIEYKKRENNKVEHSKSAWYYYTFWYFWPISNRQNFAEQSAKFCRPFGNCFAQIKNLSIIFTMEQLKTTR